MSKQDLLKIQTCVLKVNIDCDGCAQKVKKILQKIDGVYSVKIDAGGGKVVVAGDVDPEKLVKKIKVGGKHAEIWGGQNRNHHINPKFQTLQVDNNKVGRDIKSQNQKGQKGGDGGGGGKGQGQVGQMAHFTNMKGIQDLKEPVKEQISVRFNLPEKEFEASDDGFDEYEDSLDDYDDEEEDEDEVIGHGHGYGHGNPIYHKMMPKMGDGGGPHGPAGVMNGPAINNGHKDNAGGSRNNNGSDKKGGNIDQAMLIKGKGGNYNEAKVDDNEGKKSSQKGKKKKKDEIKKKDGGLLGRFLSFGGKSKKVGLKEVTYTSSKNQSNESGNKKDKEGKMKDHSNGKNDFDFLDYDKTPLLHKNGKVGQMDPSQKGYQALEGDAMGHQGMQMQHVPYNNLLQQQYMAMMMNQPQHQHQHHYQHETNMNNMYPTNMMYGRPHPSMNYMAPPPMPSHPMADPITHTFSDENVESCRIM